MILFYVVFGILVGATVLGIILENKGFFKIPNDEVMVRYLKLTAYRAKRKREILKNGK